MKRVRTRGSQPETAVTRPPSLYVGALVTAVLFAVVLVGTGVAMAHGKPSPTNLQASGPRPQPPAKATAPSTTRPKPVSTTRAKPSTTVPIPKVVSMVPANAASAVPWGEHIVIKLSSAPALGAPMPTLRPAVAGQWYVSGDSLIFEPTVGYSPWQIEHVEIPAALATGPAYQFTTAGVSMVRTQQLLAELNYLPVTFTTDAPEFTYDSEPTQASLVSDSPQPGKFLWAYSNVPPELSSQWAQGRGNVLTTGAIMHFEAVQGLSVDGIAGPDVWTALKVAAAKREYNPDPYTYLMASETLPEKLVVWDQGKYVFETLANTGVYGATTQPGTFPVYARYESTTMKGTDPDGTKYDIADVPWVAYFNGGDAVHGFPRYSYGWPQSNGCVELPIANAQVVWGLDPIGTLVTVMTGPLPANS